MYRELERTDLKKGIYLSVYLDIDLVNKRKLFTS